MSTLSYSIVQNIMHHNGLYDGLYNGHDYPRYTKVIKYTNAWGGESWAAVAETDQDPDRYERPTEYVRNPQVVWRYQP